MGNRGLLRAVQRIISQVQTITNIVFGQIILAAPDVDIDLFKELAKGYGQLAERTTLYISSKDKALATSGFIYQHDRAGFFPLLLLWKE
jgi:esterase/lipase superfamily enzyme